MSGPGEGRVEGAVIEGSLAGPLPVASAIIAEEGPWAKAGASSRNREGMVPGKI